MAREITYIYAMRNGSSAYEEVIGLFDLLSQVIPQKVDGKKAILEMKKSGNPNWRQMEWIGFWFEFFVERNVIPKLGGTSGPTFGTTKFDFKKKFVWDLKAHPVESKKLILNDQLAFRECVRNQNGLGFIVVSGNTTYDDTERTFKKWHDELKGGISSYEKERVNRGAPSRRRKVSFFPTNLDSIWFENTDEVDSAIKGGWLKTFQTGMRNSNSKPRPAKYVIDLKQVPSDHLILSQSIN